MIERKIKQTQWQKENSYLSVEVSGEAFSWNLRYSDGTMYAEQVYESGLEGNRFSTSEEDLGLSRMMLSEEEFIEQFPEIKQLMPGDTECH